MSGQPKIYKVTDFPVSRTFAQHTETSFKGIDYVTPIGTLCTILEDGIVDYAGYDGIDTPKGQAIFLRVIGKTGSWEFVHLEQVLVTKGQHVKVGQPAFITGNSGMTSGPHTHAALKINGVYVDPQPYINKLNVKQLIMDKEVKDAFARIEKKLSTMAVRQVTTKDLVEGIYYFQRGQTEVVKFNNLLIQTAYKPEKKNDHILVRYSEDNGSSWKPWLEDGVGTAPVTHIVSDGKYSQFVRGANYGDWMRSTVDGKIWTEWKEI